MEERERWREVIWLEKKEQHDSDIEEDGREFGSRLEELRWRSWFVVFLPIPNKWLVLGTDDVDMAASFTNPGCIYLITYLIVV